MADEFQTPPQTLTYRLGTMVAERPRQKECVRSYSLWDEMLLYSSNEEMAFSLNGSAKAIWELCDGSRTITEISQELGRCFGASGEALLPDVIAAITQLHQLGLLKLAGTPHALAQ